MDLASISAFCLYLTILITIGFASKKRHQTSGDFILGSRKMNFWLTALAAHASDMSSWIFMAYPAVIYALGLSQAWAAIGLTLFMFLNWQFVAPRLRVMTESYESLTLSSFFESRFSDTTGLIRIATVIASLIFYTIYISSGLVALGLLIETLFGFSYIVGISIGIFVIIPYLFIGGYITLAWTDFFQGLFLMSVIVFVPLYALTHSGGLNVIAQAMKSSSSLSSFLPENSWSGWISILFITCGWGLGYFGQPHIITKFMGISDVTEIPKSKWVGISWQIISLSAATLVGIVGVVFYQNSGLDNQQLIFIEMALRLFPPFIATFILCAILGATITCMDSQILVLASNLTEDFYKRIIRKSASSKELLLISRLSIILIALISYAIACTTTSSIFSLVSYAWFGLGAAFGPLVLFSLYSKRANRAGAWGGLISGTLIALTWPLINRLFSIEIPSLIPGFLISSFTIWALSSITQYKNDQQCIGTLK